jgi:UDP-4-amino-4,6-dideoxy-N-acetyl-beta-L-altrosamine N-acetyltransferase
MKTGSLRLASEQDLEKIREWRNSPEIRDKMYTRHEITESEHFEWWKSLKEKRKIAILYEAEGIPQGFLSFGFINEEKTVATWAFYAAPTAKKGTGARMEYLALNYAFFELNLHRLECEVLSSNTTVARLHQKFGFQLEGRAREHYYDGQSYIDVIKFGMLSHEWEAKKDEMKRTIERL